MVEITIEAIKELREATGAGVLDCKKALADAEGDVEEATRLLREKGMAVLAKRSEREVNEGRVDGYIHHSNRVGALIELNCETDFVARTEEFVELAHDLAMQVAASNPQFLSIEDVPEEVLEEKREEFRAEFVGDKPERIIDQIVVGKMNKFYGEACLLEQPYIRDGDIQVKDLIAELAVKMGENIVLRRFARYELGE